MELILENNIFTRIILEVFSISNNKINER